MCKCVCMCACGGGGGGGSHFLLFFCCWRVPMSAPARSYSVAWAGQASASLAYMTPPHTRAADLWHNCSFCWSGLKKRRWTLEYRRQQMKEEKKGRFDWSFKTCWCRWNNRYRLNTVFCIDVWSHYQQTLNGKKVQLEFSGKRSESFGRQLMQSEGQFGWKENIKNCFILVLQNSLVTSTGLSPGFSRSKPPQPLFGQLSLLRWSTIR